MATVNRVNGMVSGFDTETLVKNLMKLEKTKTDKVFRDKQSVIWQKDAYKEMMSLFRGFQSDFLDVLKPGSNMRSKTAFSSFTAGAKINGVDTSKVSVTTSSSSVQGTITIDSITQLAQKDTWQSVGEVKALQGTLVDVSALNTEILSGNNTIKVTVDGVTKSIDLAGAYTEFNNPDPAVTTDLVSDLQSKLNTAFGTDKVTVSGTEADKLLVLDSVGSTVTVSTEDANVLGALGFASGDSNVLSYSATLGSAFGLGSDTTISINNKSIELKTTDSVQAMIQKINTSGAGVTLSYSSLNNGFTLKSNNEGAVYNISMDAAAETFMSDKLLLTAGGHTAGQDAMLTVNGVATTRSTNSIVVDGTTIQLKEISTTAAIDISISANSAPVKDNIVKFVNRYNDLIEKVYDKINETKNRDYTPLTDEEKSAMSEDSIKLWEDKAKSGLIKSDSILTNMMTQLRTAFSETVAGAGITLQEMGITTSSNYKDNGKLVIDESVLNDALTNKSAEITAFFTNESTFQYGDSTNSSTRYSENGLSARINDILNDNIRITRDTSGKRGFLVEKAGYEKSSSDTSSDLAKKITALEDRYAVLLEKMNDTEDRYYAKFTAMESALSKMNAQSSSLASMFSSSS